MTKCRSCQAEIRWAKTPGGARMPLDVSPAPGGNVAVLESKNGPIAVVLNAKGEAAMPFLQPSPDAPRYLSHFVTCPSAGLHRKPKT